MAFEGFAMPTEEAAARAEPVVQKLLESEQDALASGRKTRTQVADAAMKLAEASDSEAAKMLLMKGAVALYVRDGNIEKAVGTMNALEAAISDMPSQCVTNIIEWALLGVPKKSGVRFYQILDESRSAGETPPPLKDASSRGGAVSAALQERLPRFVLVIAGAAVFVVAAIGFYFFSHRPTPPSTVDDLGEVFSSSGIYKASRP